MIRKCLLLVPVLALAVFASCTQELESQAAPVGPNDDAVLTKIVKLGDEYESGTLLVKLESGAQECELAILQGCGVSSVEKLFKSFPGKEDLEARFGLDRWYVATLESGVSADMASASLAALDVVAAVEYSCIAAKCSDCISYPYEGEVVPTKASVFGIDFNDPMISDQWHYCNLGSGEVSINVYKGADINVKDVWSKLTAGSPDIVVAVVDEGVKHTHPDLAANMWVNKGEIPGNGIDDDGNGYVDDVYGYNFVDNGEINWTKEGNSGHGTHCAGTIAAVNNNGKGVCGVAGGSGKGDGCRIMSCQIFSGGRGGSVSQTANAIKYAADMGASIISCSFGYQSQYQSDNAYLASQGTAEIDAVHYFEASRNNDVLDGNIAIFASGNDTHNYAHYPGAFVDVISVSAFGPDLLPTYYTNYGPGCNICAPGGEAYHSRSSVKSMVLSTVPSEIESLGATGNVKADYAYMQGTSMACPHVSGVVALALSYAHQKGKKFSREDFKKMILSSTNDIDQRIASVGVKTYAHSQSDLKLTPYYHNVGTGAVDAWRLCMKVDGIHTTTAHIGAKQWLDLSEYFGTSSVSLTYLAVDVPQETVDALGLKEIAPSSTSSGAAVPEKGYAYIQFGRLYLHPTKLGSGTITVTAVGGGDHVGGGNALPGGMEISQTISIIARDVNGGNGTGGWL